MSTNSDITVNHIHGLLENFSKNVYRAKDDEEGSLNNDVMEKCQSLFRLDYDTVEIQNSGGGLSSHYPAVIVIPEFEKQKPNNLCSTIQSTSNGPITKSPFTEDPSTVNVSTNIPSSQRTQQPTIYEKSYEKIKLRELMTKARLARSRTRFPTPVILYKGKFICRSSTLSSGAELYTRSSINYLFNATTGTATEPNITDNVDAQGNDDAIEANENLMAEQDDINNPIESSLINPVGTNGKPLKPSEWPLFDNVRSSDIKLLEALNVGTIIDFMVEKKKVKFGLKVTSSEKVDKENRYKDFKLISLPYPGCEFFREFRDNNYSHEHLIFDWSQAYVDADMCIPEDTISNFLNINWTQYKEWNLVTITQNYLKLCLKYLQDNNSGLLIHCISGWDRTPLFISLLRLSLWADGVIHQSLNAIQILFLTLAYDWFLFGHDLPDRLTKGEDIFMFCFYALKYIQEEDYSVISHRHRTKQNSSGSCSNTAVPQENESNLETLQFDIDSRSSSISHSSGGSQQDIYQHKQFSNDIHENTNGNIANLTINQDSNSSIEIIPEPTVNSYSPISKRKTSPVTVPYSSRSRQRNESTSSVGSWQMVNQSGSLRSTDSNQLRPQNSILQDSNSTLVDDDIFSNNQNAVFIRRRDRLQSVRATFYKCYCKAIGFPYKNGAELTSLGSMLGNIAERVGFSQRTQM